MRIAYVCADPGVPAFGAKGCSVHVQEGLRALLALGGAVTLFATRPGGTPPADLAGVPVHRLPAPVRTTAAAREQGALAANPVLAESLEREGPFDLVYERYALWSHAGMEYARATGTPGLLEVNAPLIEEQALHRGLVDRPGAEAVARRVFSAASALLAVSRVVAAYLEGFPEARGRVHVVPNGVDARRFRPGLVPSLPASAGVFTVGFVGSLKPWHGLPDLVAAFDRFHRQVPASRLLIVGDGPERARLSADLEERGLAGAACLTGAVPPADVPALVASMDVAVAPYPRLDACYFSPLKVYEYMAAGVPVVAGRTGQVAHLIRDGLDGLLYPPGEVEVLASVLFLLWHEPALRMRLARAARAGILERHTWEAVFGRVMALGGLERPRRREVAG